MENIEVLLQSTIKLKSEVKQEQNIIHGGFSEEFRDEKHFEQLERLEIPVKEEIDSEIVQEDAAHQRAPHAQGPYGKITPPGLCQMPVMPSLPIDISLYQMPEIPAMEIPIVQMPVMLLPTMKRRLGQMGPVGHLMPMDPLANLRCPTNPAHQQNPRLPSSQLMQQQQQLVQVPPQQQVIGVMCGPSHVSPRPDIRAQQPGTNGGIGAAGVGGNAPGKTHNRKHVMRQLITALKSPNAPDIHAEICLILESNPLLFEEFLKRAEERQLSLTQNEECTRLFLEFMKQRRECQLSQAQNRNQVNTGQGTGGVMVPNLQQQQ